MTICLADAKRRANLAGTYRSNSSKASNGLTNFVPVGCFVSVLCLVDFVVSVVPNLPLFTSILVAIGLLVLAGLVFS